MAGKHVALRAMGGMLMVLDAWCVVSGGMVVITTINTLVSIPTTQAREEHSHCD